MIKVENFEFHDFRSFTDFQTEPKHPSHNLSRIMQNSKHHDFAEQSHSNVESITFALFLYFCGLDKGKFFVGDRFGVWKPFQT